MGRCYTRTHAHMYTIRKMAVRRYMCTNVCMCAVASLCTCVRPTGICVCMYLLYMPRMWCLRIQNYAMRQAHTHTLFATTPKQRRHIIWLIHHYAEFTELVFAVICSRRPNMEWIRYYGDCISYIKCTSWRKPPALNILAAFCIYLARFFRKYIFIGHDLFIIFFCSASLARYLSRSRPLFYYFCYSQANAVYIFRVYRTQKPYP